MIDLVTLPIEVRALIEAQTATIARQDAELVAHRDVIAAMRLQLDRLRRMQFGRSSERIAAEIAQLTLALEDLETGAARKSEPADADPASPVGAARERPARRPLPDHLPRATITHETACACPQCGGALRLLGEDVTEALDYVPASFRVIRHVRPKFSCRACESITQAPTPELPIRRGRASASLLAHVLVAKFADHLPLYRQSEIYARSGVELERSTLADWVGQCAGLLRPLIDALGRHVMAGDRVHADDTPVPVLAPGAGKTKVGRLWAYLRDELVRKPNTSAVTSPSFSFRTDVQRVQMPAKHASGRVSSNANHTGGRRPSGCTSCSAKLVKGTRHRLSTPSQRRECGDFTLRMLVTPGSVFSPCSANTGEGMPQRAIVSSRPASAP